MQRIAGYFQGRHTVMQFCFAAPDRGGMGKLNSSLHATHQDPCPGSGLCLHRERASIFYFLFLLAQSHGMGLPTPP